MCVCGGGGGGGGRTDPCIIDPPLHACRSSLRGVEFCKQLYLVFSCTMQIIY